MPRRLQRGPIYLDEDLDRWKAQALELPEEVQINAIRKAGFPTDDFGEGVQDYDGKVAVLMEVCRLREERQGGVGILAESSEEDTEAQQAPIPAATVPPPQITTPTPITPPVPAKRARQKGRSEEAKEQRKIKRKEKQKLKGKAKRKNKYQKQQNQRSSDSETSQSQSQSEETTQESSSEKGRKKPRLEDLPEDVIQEVEKIQTQKKQNKNAELIMKDLIEETFETKRKDFDPEQWLPKEGIDKEVALNTWQHNDIIPIAKPKAKSWKERGNNWSNLNHSAVAAHASSLNVMLAYIGNKPLLGLIKQNVRMTQTTVSTSVKLRDYQNVDFQDQGLVAGAIPASEVLSSQVSNRVNRKKKDRQKRFTTPFQRSLTPNPTTTTTNATATPTTPAASTPTYNTAERSNSGYQRRGGYRGNR
ncbi:MAG: hypothetical protein EZS28_014259 [Streblomastix strix]|uniref:Uncharacterized protein n=1 Tax=Streblomastix strix TaxID=222440 RepID=A0A5J4W667_9EUKA|nr:MAG: hypothetical protein EZS28_014259 [Streblomastix strix]